MQNVAYHILPSQSVYLPDFLEFGAGEKVSWQDETLDNHPARSDKLWSEARALRDFLADRTPAQQAQEYFDRYPNYPPDRFYTSTRQRVAAAKTALKPSGWATHLLDQLDHPDQPAYFYSLHMTHLGLPVDYANPQFMFYPLVIEAIKEAIAKHIPKPYYWKLEVGRDHALHVHLIAGRPLPQLGHLARSGSKVIQPIKPGTEHTLLAYLSKPTAPWSAGNYANYLEAKATKQTSRLPNLSGLVGLSRQRKNQS
jgi:hypothetical protein